MSWRGKLSSPVRGASCTGPGCPQSPIRPESRPSQPRTPGRKGPLVPGLDREDLSLLDVRGELCLAGSQCPWSLAGAETPQDSWAPGPFPPWPGGDTQSSGCTGPRGWAMGAQHPESETPALASAPPPPHETSALHQEPVLPWSGGPVTGVQTPRRRTGPMASMHAEAAPRGATRVLPGSNRSPSGHHLPGAGVGPRNTQPAPPSS